MTYPHLTIALVNHKGGVGKTSVSANLAGQLALNGAKVLLVDLDPQGNQRIVLGYRDNPADDHGWGTVQAVYAGESPTIITDVRPGLDVIPGGAKLNALTALSYTPGVEDLPGGGVPGAFADMLHRNAQAGGYDFVLIDCPPGNPLLQEAALAAARYVLVPVRTDAMSWDGLYGVGPLVRRAREANPALTYLGAVLFASQTTASRPRTAARLTLGEITDTIPLLTAFIRHSETAGADASLRGQLAHELARDAAALREQRLKALSARKPGQPLTLPALSGSARGVADDYAALLREIVHRIGELEARHDPDEHHPDEHTDTVAAR